MISEREEYTFKDGGTLVLTNGEDGITVQIDLGKLVMGTFTNFENMLYGIAQVVQENVSCKQEFVKFAEELSLTLSNTLVIDEIEEILLK